MATGSRPCKPAWQRRSMKIPTLFVPFSFARATIRSTGQPATVETRRAAHELVHPVGGARTVRAAVAGGRDGRYRLERPSPDVAVVELLGEHDAKTMADLRERLDALAATTDLVVIDLTRTEFIDAAVMNSFVRLDKNMRSGGRHFRVQLGTLPIVERALEVTGLLTALDVVRTRADAVQPVPGMPGRS